MVLAFRRDVDNKLASNLVHRPTLGLARLKIGGCPPKPFLFVSACVRGRACACVRVRTIITRRCAFILFSEQCSEIDIDGSAISSVTPAYVI